MWHATNLNGFSFAGTEASLTWLAGHGQQVNLAYTWLHGAQSVLNGLQSEYLFNYPVNNAVFNWYSNLGRWVMVNTRVGVQQRFQQTAYPVWDVSVVHEHGRFPACPCPVEPFSAASKSGSSSRNKVMPSPVARASIH
jgi:iron complex outermembrane receptor protein